MLYLNLESLHLLAKGKDNEALHPQAMVADRDIHQTTHLRVTIRLKAIIQASVKDLCQDLAIHLLILIPGNTPSNLVQCKVNGDEAQDLRDTMATWPLERTLLETDGPYLTPEPHRGRRRRNEPMHIPIIGQRLADVKGVSSEEVARVTTQACRDLFQWP